MAKTEHEVEALTAQIEPLRQRVHEGAESLTGGEIAALREQIRTLQAARAAAIVDGCSPCPSCGQEPIGMLQNVAIDHQARAGYEIGCGQCLDHRAFGLDLEGARRAWERGPQDMRGWRQPKPEHGRTLDRTPDGIVSRFNNGAAINWSRLTTAEERKQALRLAKSLEGPPISEPATTVE